MPTLNQQRLDPYPPPILSLRTILLALSTLGAVSADSGEVVCRSFHHITDNVQVVSSTFYPAGSLVNISNAFQSIDTTTLPAFCRVQLAITTNATAGSIARTEVWLPEAWNGRFLTIGNAGFSGGVAVADLALIATTQGYVGVSTDSGHSANSADGSWALNNDNAMIDFGWRAMHLSVVYAKEVVEKYYGRPHSRAYFLGCSEVSLKEVQEFPDDFDGVVVGSPANWGSHFLAAQVRGILNVQPVNSSNWISEKTWTDIIHPEVLRQCDELDGLADGIISNPQICAFHPETLACRLDQDTSTCLTIEQIQTVHKIYADYYDVNQTYVFSGFYPGAEPGLPQYIFGSEPIHSGEDYYRYFVLNDTNWNISQFTYATIEEGDRVNSGQSNAISPNLTAFAGPNHKGKLIHYVGWAENLISAGHSLHYYETVNSLMRLQDDAEMDSFYRMFVVPGMEHCYFGDGANAFGGVSQAVFNMPPLSHDILSAVVRWVEDGIPPSTITAAHYTNNTASSGVAFTRPLCKYPATAKYVGSDPNASSSFKCV
ncbi:feruloyl esterase-like protein [Panus rudis PR-1116 ss-1]|nr:feruloyl esterase-like protein [Panus rudis PR-1116 ss-1]